VSKKLHELFLCAREQGYFTNLKPLYKYPVIELDLYLTLIDILRSEEEHG